MFVKHAEIKPDRIAALLGAAEAAARAIPPAFPLDATVAVNPFMGQAHLDLATTQARLARVAGVRLTQSRAEYAAQIADGSISDFDLQDALQACSRVDKPADIAALKAHVATPAPAAPAPCPHWPIMRHRPAALTGLQSLHGPSGYGRRGISNADRPCGPLHRARMPSLRGATGPAMT